MTAAALIYLDYAATTPLDPRVAERMREVQSSAYFNPASNHVAGRQSARIVAEAAADLGALLNVEPASIIWTSGATESNNLAILGAAKQRAHRGRHLVTMRTEHKAVVDVFRALEKAGFDVTWLTPGPDGQLNLETFEAALRDDTQLVSIMQINNETGIVQDIEAIGRICRSRKILFHVDAAQAVGKVPVDVSALQVDLMSMTAHKFYGPKGIGALYVARGTALEPQMFGGGQQMRLRPGTLPVDLIAGLGAAAAVAVHRIDDDLENLVMLKERLWSGIRSIEGVSLNGSVRGTYPGILNVSIADIEGESLLLALEPLCVATGSACNSQSQEPSYVLRALGRSDQEAQSAIRFSLGRQSSKEDIDFAISAYRSAVRKLRSLAPGVAA
ncbi:MAG TPA: aminotransferase class V-fold PLP-dependent enzyme [Woeseiaceae bacterium]|nr:aminotransferase class V-fold PLP-dependent enzyme [Woeseiaceae bacterium]